MPPGRCYSSAVNRLSGPLGAALTFLGVALIAVGCSRSGLDDQLGPGVEPDGGGIEGSYDDGPIPEGAPPPTCGNGKCDNGETCQNCAIDCGLCPGCGDGKCDNGETCSSCPQDCGMCATCGDGKCQKPEETCLNCPLDCGACPGCPDGNCNEPNKTCYTCPMDCGKCPGCGDGICESNESCQSCPEDCGPCDVCGNGVCKMPYETCINCPQDCGMCTVKTCLQAFECAIGCLGGLGGGGGGGGGFNLDGGTNPVGCLTSCVAEACIDGQYFANQAAFCILQAALGQCMGFNLNCVMSACSSDITACINSHC